MKNIFFIFCLVAAASAFYNPIFPGRFADPWCIKIGKWYYLTASTGQNDITLKRSLDFSSYKNAESHVVWKAPASLPGPLWAPEMHLIDNHLYIYFSATTLRANHTTPLNDDHRMYVLKAKTSDPFGAWDFVGKISTADDNWAIDGTVWNYNNKLYFVWSGWIDAKSGNNQHIYIASMKSATALSSERVLIHSPTQAWMKSGPSGVNEGPEILVHQKRIFLIYSAAGSWGPDYCLGLIEFVGKDPLSLKSWKPKDDAPVMKSGNGVYGPGHCTFTKDDKNNDYIIYHANISPKDSWPQRTPRSQKLTFDSSGFPLFPSPKNFTEQCINPIINK